MSAALPLQTGRQRGPGRIPSWRLPQDTPESARRSPDLGSAVARVTVSPAAVTAVYRRFLAPGVGSGASPLKGAGS
jgi:hypothetical protein